MIVNLFNGPEGSKQRRRIEDVALNLEAVVGLVATFPVEFPVNVVLAARKERTDGFGDQEDPRFTRKGLKTAGREISKELGFEWDAGDMLEKAYWVETDGGTSFKERPAGLSLNPLSRFVNRMGTTMPDGGRRRITRRCTTNGARGEGSCCGSIINYQTAQSSDPAPCTR